MAIKNCSIFSLDIKTKAKPASLLRHKTPVQPTEEQWQQLFIAADFKLSLSLNIINFIIVYQSQTVHREMREDKTPVQPTFQYRGKKCKLSYRMVSLLVTL